MLKLNTNGLFSYWRIVRCNTKSLESKMADDNGKSRMVTVATATGFAVAAVTTMGVALLAAGAFALLGAGIAATVAASKRDKK